jgi:hypothetical protein
MTGDEPDGLPVVLDAVDLAVPAQLGQPSGRVERASLALGELGGQLGTDELLRAALPLCRGHGLSLSDPA